jgi:DME family drug/metabolite transporter
MSRSAKVYIIAIIGIAFWLTTAVFLGYLLTYYQMPALVLAFWRNLLVCAALIPALFFVQRPLLSIRFSQVRFYILYGLVLAVFNSIWTLSVQENGAAVATVLAYSSAGFTAILAFFIFRELLGYAKILAILLSLSGCVMAANAYRGEMWQTNPLGVTTGLITGVLFAAYTLFGKEASRREMNVWTSLLYSFAFGAFFIMLFNLLPFLPGAAGSFSALIPNLPVKGWGSWCCFPLAQLC